jgi:hypothetical protein
MDGSASMSRGRSDPLLTNLVIRTNRADTWMAFSTPAQHGTAQRSMTRLRGHFKRWILIQIWTYSNTQVLELTKSAL